MTFSPKNWLENPHVLVSPLAVSYTPYHAETLRPTHPQQQLITVQPGQYQEQLNKHRLLQTQQ